MTSVRIRPGTVEPVAVQELNRRTGITDLYVRVWSHGLSQFLDFAAFPSMSFSGAPAQLNSPALLEVDATVQPGLYRFPGAGLDHSQITNPLADDTLLVLPFHGAGSAEFEAGGEIKVGQVDDVSISQQEVQDAMSAQGYTAVRAVFLDFLDAAVSSRAVPGDAMALTPAERATTAGVVRDTDLTGAPAGSLGDAVLIARNARSAYRIDGGPGAAAIQRNAQGFITSARLRIFADQAAAAASTAGAAGNEGALYVSTISGVANGAFPGLPDTVLAGV